MRAGRSIAAAALVLSAAAGCERRAADQPTAGPGGAGAPGRSAAVRTRDPTPVGRWAARADLCERSAWTVSPTGFVTDAGVRCDLASVGATAAGWVAAAECPNVGEGRVQLNTTADDPTTLVVSGGPFASPVSLVRCPEPEQRAGGDSRAGPTAGRRSEQGDLP